MQLVPHPGLPPVDETIFDVEVVGDDVRLWRYPALANAGNIAVVVVAADGTPTLYRGLTRPPFLPGNPAILQAALVGPLGALPPHSALAGELQTAQPGAVLLASNDLLGRWVGHTLAVEIDVQEIQNGDGRRRVSMPARTVSSSPCRASAGRPPTPRTRSILTRVRRCLRSTCRRFAK